MAIKEIQLPGRESRAQELYSYLRQAILSGGLPPNERLVEEQIAERASVSRTPVREAIRKLEVDGLVRQTRFGVVVVALSDTDLRELCEVRVVLEGLACRLAAESRSLLDLDVLHRIQAEYRGSTTAGTNMEAIIGANLAFHETIWRMANNEYLANALAVLRARIQGLQASTLTISRRLTESSSEHDQLLQNIEDRDSAGAEGIARIHFGHAMALRLSRRTWDDGLREREG